MLDIGCGWGSLAIHAAREHGASVSGITLSEPQAQLARERAREAGVEDRVEFRVMDYRDLGAERFDAVASIGMVEHVGEAQIDEYARQIARVAEPGGRVLNHGIVVVAPQQHGVHIGGEFSDRYVFPDGELLNLSRMLLAFERAGFEALNVENLHTDYAETLRHWTTRLDDHLDQAERLAGSERLRVWRLYLRAARNSFETGSNAVYQLLCSRPLTEGASSLAHRSPPRAGAPASPTGARPGIARLSKPVHIGCSGWNYRDWRGVIYPEGLPARRWLERYAELLRHGRGQRDLLPAAVRERRRGLGRTDPARASSSPSRRAAT